MVKQKIYLETTMFNYYFDKDRELHPAVVAAFEAIGVGDYEGYTSNYALDELMLAPEPKKGDMLGLIAKYGITTIDGSDEAERMADIYIEHDAIPKNKRLDALHIASASINGREYIMSLNFKHINKVKTKRIVDFINVNEGYKSIVICAPMEVIDYEPEY
jgi:predicted nucleic acid-binding protein